MALALPQHAYSTFKPTEAIWGETQGTKRDCIIVYTPSRFEVSMAETQSEHSESKVLTSVPPALAQQDYCLTIVDTSANYFLHYYIVLVIKHCKCQMQHL